MSTQAHDEALHPRETTGKFATKPTSDAAGGLDALGAGRGRQTNEALAQAQTWGSVSALVAEAAGNLGADNGENRECRRVLTELAELVARASLTSRAQTPAQTSATPVLAHPSGAGEVQTWMGEDGVPVFQIDTTGPGQRVRINLNDGPPIWDGNPEADQPATAALEEIDAILPEGGAEYANLLGGVIRIREILDGRTK